MDFLQKKNYKKIDVRRLACWYIPRDVHSEKYYHHIKIDFQLFSLYRVVKKDALAVQWKPERVGLRHFSDIFISVTHLIFGTFQSYSLPMIWTSSFLSADVVYHTWLFYFAFGYDSFFCSSNLTLRRRLFHLYKFFPHLQWVL